MKATLWCAAYAAFDEGAGREKAGFEAGIFQIRSVRRGWKRSEGRLDQAGHYFAKAASPRARRRHLRRKEDHESRGADCAPEHG